MVEEENKINRKTKIATITLISASIAFLASMYMIEEDEDDIFGSAKSSDEIHKIWLEFNRKNHPDKCNLEGDELKRHMEKYHETKKHYEDRMASYIDKD